MAPPNAYTLPTYCPLEAHTFSSHGGQPIEGKGKEQGHSLLFHLRNCQASTLPQLATDPFLLCRFASHAAVSMFGAKVWWMEGQKVGVAWDLSCAVPKLAKIKRLKLVKIRPWKHMFLRKKQKCVLGFKTLTFNEAIC